VYYPAQPAAKCRDAYWTGDLAPGEDPARIPWTHPRPHNAPDGNSVGDVAGIDIASLTLPSTCAIEKLRQNLGEADGVGEITLASGLARITTTCADGYSGWGSVQVKFS
jgi:hypothetical protein